MHTKARGHGHQSWGCDFLFTQPSDRCGQHKLVEERWNKAHFVLQNPSTALLWDLSKRQLLECQYLVFVVKQTIILIFWVVAFCLLPFRCTYFAAHRFYDVACATACYWRVIWWLSSNAGFVIFYELTSLSLKRTCLGVAMVNTCYTTWPHLHPRFHIKLYSWW